MERKELVEKLDVISKRYKEVVAIKQKIASYKPEDNYKRQVILPNFPDANGDANRQLILLKEVEHSSNEANASVKQVYERVFPVPKEPIPKKFSENDSSSGLGCAAFIALGVGIFFALGGIFGSGSAELLAWTRPIIFTIAGISVGIFGVLLVANLIKQKTLKIKENKRKKELDEQNNEAREEYERELCEYKQKEQAFFDAYWDWRAVYLEALDEEKRIKTQIELDRQAGVKEIEANELLPAQEKLNEANDLISDEYLPAIDTITSLIRSGRADDLKEAINLHEEILYRERQMQFEKEKEEQ